MTVRGRHSSYVSDIQRNIYVFFLPRPARPSGASQRKVAYLVRLLPRTVPKLVEEF